MVPGRSPGHPLPFMQCLLVSFFSARLTPLWTRHLALPTTWGDECVTSALCRHLDFSTCLEGIITCPLPKVVPVSCLLSCVLRLCLSLWLYLRFRTTLLLGMRGQRGVSTQSLPLTGLPALSGSCIFPLAHASSVVRHLRETSGTHYRLIVNLCFSFRRGSFPLSIPDPHVLFCYFYPCCHGHWSV